MSKFSIVRISIVILIDNISSPYVYEKVGNVC